MVAIVISMPSNHHFPDLYVIESMKALPAVAIS